MELPIPYPEEVRALSARHQITNLFGRLLSQKGGWTGSEPYVGRKLPSLLV